MSKGLTMLEILTSIAVIAVVVVIVVSALAVFRRSADLNSAVDGVYAQLREARRRTIESKDASRWGVHVESSRTTLFKGATYSSGAADNEVSGLPSTVTIAGPTDIVFKRLSGDTDNSGTLTLTSIQDTSKTKTIIIRSSGLIEIP